MTSALILAAGRGSRLAPHTDTMPKCMVPFLGRPLFDWQLAALKEVGITDVQVVTGYRPDAFRSYGLTQWHNPQWDSTNMVASLVQARDLLSRLSDDLLILYSDLVYEPRTLRAICAEKSDFSVVVDRDWLKLWSLRMDNPLDDAETLDHDAEGTLLDIGRKAESLDQIKGQYVGVMKLAPAAARILLGFWDASDEAPEWALGKSKDNAYMTDLIRGMIDAGHAWQGVFVKNGWLEVDTTEDLSRYEADRNRGTMQQIIDMDKLRTG